ncbi:redoxin domain-containing protein [Puteibacter caeruleilacunae]|nr:redoxin domain-containing protein [Puteibacter caeruleilacunae]
MNRRIKFVAFIICLALISVNVLAGNQWKDKVTTIYGKVINPDNELRTISFSFSDILELNERFTAIIDDTGSFEIKIPMSHSQTFLIKYGTTGTLFCSPGSSLFVAIDGGILKNTENRYPNGKFFLQFDDSELGRTNRNINDFFERRPDDEYIGVAVSNAVTQKTADEYASYIRKREEKYRNFLNVFIKQGRTPMFRRWVDDALKFETWDDLMRYSWEHPYRNNQEEKSFNLPEDYFEFMADYDMMNSDIITWSHASFLEELYVYQVKKIADEAKNVYETEGFNGMFGILRKHMDNSCSGFTKDMFFAKYLVAVLKGNMIKEFEEIYSPDLISDEYLSQLVDTEYATLKKKIAGSTMESANVINVENEHSSDFFGSVIEKYRGKVIYVDFWAPWCGPCMEEMAKSKKIQQQLEGKDVVFLFLASQCSEESWKATIATKQLKGEHLRLTKDQYNILQAQYGISGIPHYLLIDTEGAVVFENAPRPSQVERLVEEIEKLIPVDDEMVFVEGGEYKTKRREGKKWTKVTLQVSNFLIDPYEVTVQKFADFVNATSYMTVAEKLGESTIYGGEKKKGVNWRHDAKGNLRPKSDYDHPVIHLTPKDAQAYAKWCGKRLPHEAEWEYASRGGKLSKSYVYAGGNKQNKLAWNANNSRTGNTHQVGLLAANEIGLYDMSGNVQEFCSNKVQIQNGVAVIVKGGAFNCDEEYLASYYSWIVPFDQGPTFMSGFRCVRDAQ